MIKKLLFGIVILLGFQAQGQLFEGFETTALPDTGSGVWQLPSGAWHVSDNAVGVNVSWAIQPVIYAAYSGANAAFINRENIGAGNTSEDWLVTPLIALDDNSLLSFFSRETLVGDTGTIYKIMLSTTSQTDHSTFTPIQSHNELWLNATFGIYEQKIIDLQGYAGQSVYIAFVREFTQPTIAISGDRWLLDNVQVGEGFFNVITGSVSLANTSAACDTAAAIPLDGIGVIASFGSNSGMQYTVNGNYNLTVIADQITITPDINLSYFDVTPPSTQLTITASQDEAIVANFCVVPGATPHHDIKTMIVPVNNARPGFDSSYRIIVRNRGNRVESGTVVLNFDGNVLDYVSANPAVASQTANSVSWNFTDLPIFGELTFTVTLNLNSPTEIPAVNIGNTLYFESTSLPVDTDEDLTDNTATLTQTVTGSQDPNDKLVSEGETITPEQAANYLHYTIRFQNMGTAPATFIRVEDAIEDQLDIASLQIESASHNFTANVREHSVEFLFNDINLPAASADEPASHGYVSFRIKPKTTVVLGDVIENNAQIFFDFNLPIVTNTVATTVALLKTQTFENGKWFTVYPNPVSSVLNIKSDTKIDSIAVINNIGQTVLSQRNGNAIDVSQLTSGIYLVKANSEKGSIIQKFIKL